MTMTTIQIEIGHMEDLGEQPVMFTQTVKPGAKIYFKSDSKVTVDFPDSSPFGGENSFSVPAGDPEVVKEVLPSAAHQSYRFSVQKSESKISKTIPKTIWLQLTVGDGGIGKVGFFVEGLERGFFDAYAQVWAPAGPLEVSFEKLMCNGVPQVRVAHFTIDDSNGNSLGEIHLDEDVTSEKSKPLNLEDALRVGLMSAVVNSKPYESGGTKVVDIIVDPIG